MVTPAVKREAVAHLRQAHEMSERRACRVIGCVRMTVRYRSRRIDDRGLTRTAAALARERRRFGYRRLHVLLRREGFVVNHKRLFRIYREERLMVRKRGGRKRALGTRAPIPVAAAAATTAGRSTSSPISWHAAGASASWRSSTTAPANAWRRRRLSRCPASGSRASSIF